MDKLPVQKFQNGLKKIRDNPLTAGTSFIVAVGLFYFLKSNHANNDIKLPEWTAPNEGKNFERQISQKRQELRQNNDISKNDNKNDSNIDNNNELKDDINEDNNDDIKEDNNYNNKIEINNEDEPEPLYTDEPDPSNIKIDKMDITHEETGPYLKVLSLYTTNKFNDNSYVNTNDTSEFTMELKDDINMEYSNDFETNNNENNNNANNGD
mmetsp:Transcript_98650/g.120788  ORF Transcript_98650/g.120788 Transcript_98650/m.120788 type:complete len:210 (+) Transcript_98650:51-680(+)